MKVKNIHERVVAATPETVGGLIDSLAGPADRLWPHEKWPAMRFDRPLQVGARGGHGPVRYFIEAYQPGQMIHFQFLKPAGFHGMHGFEIEAIDAVQTRLRHVVIVDVRGGAILAWHLVFRWLHDALIEDSLDKAAAALQVEGRRARWSRWVRMLRWFFRRRQGVARQMARG